MAKIKDGKVTQLLNKRQFAEAMGISESAFYRRLKKGEFTLYKAPNKTCKGFFLNPNDVT